jgi:transglutaminase-like putative cysteine protease
MTDSRLRGDTQDFLAPSDIVDFDHLLVAERARAIARGANGEMDLARRAYEWVRDEIRHTWDHRDETVTCSASEVLATKTGFCYAKSHLLAALLRANGIPAGFCYQRLSFDGIGSPFSLHGLNAVFLPSYGWYRIDARGNRRDVNAQFDPPNERLAFAIKIDGEVDFREILPDPLPTVVTALRAHRDARVLVENLPDVDPTANLNTHGS